MQAQQNQEIQKGFTAAPVFSISDFKDGKSYFNENGFVAFQNVFSEEEINELRAAADEVYPNGEGRILEEGVSQNRDMLFQHPKFEEVAKDKRFWQPAKELLGCPVELQHTKYNGKMPGKDSARVQWHQDFPFFPHTNTDLLAGLIHLDDEEENSGPLAFVPGSYKWGALSHCIDGEFKYECTEKNPNDYEHVALMGKRGMVSFHHSLAFHGSGHNQGSQPRRFLIFQFRAQDAIQIAGVIWKTTGYQVEPELSDRKGYARFPDGSSVEIRGRNGQLFDPCGCFAPNK